MAPEHSPSAPLARQFPTLIAAARSIRRAVLIRRRLLAALLAGLAVTATVRALSPPPADGVAVRVAAHDLPAGLAVASSDLRTVRLPGDAVPDGLVDDPVGDRLASPLKAGEPVTSARLVGPGLAGADGVSAVPIRLPDATMAGLLDVGDAVDLVATDPGDTSGSQVVASGARVLAVPPVGESRDGSSGRVVVFAIPTGEVSTVTSAGVRLFLSYVWNR